MIVKQTPGYVAADLKALLTEAGVIAVQRFISTQSNINNENKISILP
jgi:SpoVK/Ycf46/Vps4 family AAA+-type ATPase